jgi:UDP-4-amino-4-deoxy-L-arabinose formyltransferase/UDP-glucuronic acid dehydrogenase (UDP-4-keto-hexauronic acid decarboxylating)
MSAPRVVVFAYGGFGCAGIAALVRSGAQLVQAFSHHDDPAENRWWPSVAERCGELGVPCELDADLSGVAAGSAYARLSALEVDFIFSFYFRSMLPSRMLSLARHGGYNLHGSLLPRYRGRAPINWQLVHGERRSGLSLHRMVRQADAGDLAAQLAIDVGPDVDAFGLTTTLMALTPEFLDGVLPQLLALRCPLVPQDHTAATIFRGRTPQDGLIDWCLPARRIHDLIRAVAPPWPGAFTYHDAQKVFIDRSRVAQERGRQGPPGSVLDAQHIACGEGVLEVLAAADARRAGLSLPSGWIFEPPPAATPASRSPV